MKKIQSLFASMIIALSCLVFAVSAVSAQPKPEILGNNGTTGKLKDSLNQAGGEAFNTGVGKSLPGVVGMIITGILGFVGTIAFIFFLYGGFLWISAGGNEEQVGTAKKYLLNASIGIIVVIIAYSAAYYLTDLIYFAAN